MNDVSVTDLKVIEWKTPKGGRMKNTFKHCCCVLILLGFYPLTAGYCEEKASARKIVGLTDKPSASLISPAILVNGTLYISGQLPVNPENGQFEGTTMTEQAEREIKNIEILLKRAGMDLSDVVQATVYLADLSEFAEFNAVFKKYFPENPPTRATVQVSKLVRDAKIEISAIAVK